MLPVIANCIFENMMFENGSPKQGVEIKPLGKFGSLDAVRYLEPKYILYLWINIYF